MGVIGEFLRENNSLEGISLWKNAMVGSSARKIMDGLALNQSLQWLGLGCNPIGVEGAEAVRKGLSTNQTLQWLALGGCELGDDGMAHIAAVLKDDICDLQNIGLGGNGISSMGVYHIAKALWTNTRLENLGLGGNYIDAEGCEYLAEMMKDNKNLKKLILSSNLVDDIAIQAICEGLRVTSSLTTLLLAGNPFGDMGARRLVDAVVNKNKGSLKVLDIHACEISEEVERAVVAKLRSNSNLHLLGSFYGRKDHRVGDLSKPYPEIEETLAATSLSSTATAEAPVKERLGIVDPQMRQHEVF